MKKFLALIPLIFILTGCEKTYTQEEVDAYLKEYSQDNDDYYQEIKDLENEISELKSEYDDLRNMYDIDDSIGELWGYLYYDEKPSESKLEKAASNINDFYEELNDLMK